MRRSEWRPRADDPKSLLGWWWRGIVEEDRFMGLQAFSLVLSMGLLFAGVSWALAPLVVVATFCAFVRQNKVLDRLKELLPEPAPEDQFRATVAYRRKGLTTGTDVIALTFVHGWLHAEGVRSGFSLRARDVRHPPSWSDRAGCLILPDESEIHLNGLDYDARSALAAWSGAREKVQGEPTMPPATVHRAQFARWGAYFLTGLVAKLASSWFRGAEKGDWARVILHQGLWFLGLILTLLAVYRLWRLNEVHEEAKKAQPEGVVPLSVASPSVVGLGEKVEAEPQEVLRS